MQNPSSNPDHHAERNLSLKAKRFFIELKSKSPKELAAESGISVRVLRARIKVIKDKIGARVGHLFSIKQVIIYYQEYGHPGGYLIE